MENPDYEIVKYFKENFTTNPKKLKKMAQRLAPDYPDHIRRGILADVIASSDPVGYLRYAFKLLIELPEVIETIIRDGNHGFIMFKETVFPVRLKAPENWLTKEDEWNPADELDIQHKAVKDFFLNHPEARETVEVTLFKHFGFSGLPRVIQRPLKLKL